MMRRPLLIGIIVVAAIAGTSVAAAQTDFSASITDPSNPMWQQMPGIGPNGLTPTTSLTFEQVLWILAQYENTRGSQQTAQTSIQQSVNTSTNVTTPTGSYSQTFNSPPLNAASCGLYHIGDTYVSPDGCNTCSCTENGPICTMRACAPTYPTFPGSTGGSTMPPQTTPIYTTPPAVSFSSCNGHPVGETYWADECHICTCTSSGAQCQVRHCSSIFVGDSTAPIDNGTTAPIDGTTINPVGSVSSIASSSCNGHLVGESYWADECHICTCTSNGAVCQERHCGSLIFGSTTTPSTVNGDTTTVPGSTTPPVSSPSSCNGHPVGVSYWADKCHICTCTSGGAVCQERHCGSLIFGSTTTPVNERPFLNGEPVYSINGGSAFMAPPNFQWFQPLK